jgi:glycosyltransferase involved in cell wall biosynthesis
VVPCYNCAAYLGEALASALSQTLPPAEILVVDDGSTDASARVAQAHAPRVKYLYQANQGIGPARNTGVAQSRGELLAFLDADDRWEPAKLERQWAALQADASLDAVFAHAKQFVSPDVADNPDIQRLLAPEGAMAGYYASSLLIRRPAFDGVGAFATDLSVGEFIDWYARAMEAGLAMQLLPDVLVWRRIHGANSTLRHRHQHHQYARILKASLDRRRAAQSPDERNP